MWWLEPEWCRLPGCIGCGAGFQPALVVVQASSLHLPSACICLQPASAFSLHPGVVQASSLHPGVGNP
ncbi:MAG: hypothetical protein AB7S36_19730, partial [Planctomycetota bacterium]